MVQPLKALSIPWKVEFNQSISYDLRVSFLSENPKEWNTGTETNTCTLMFIVAIFTISASRWMNKMFHIPIIKCY